MSHIPFQHIDWPSVATTEYKGTTGSAFWQTIMLEGLRLRIVEYSAGYLADHWCQKGHIVHCLEGGFVTELADGAQIHTSQGGTYVVSDGLSSHRTFSENGTRLLIIDGDFLKAEEK